MTVRMLKKFLEECNDDDRVILDINENRVPNKENEIISVYRYKTSDELEYRPVVLLQTRDDFDWWEEKNAIIFHFQYDMDPDTLKKTLLEIGYTEDEIEPEITFIKRRTKNGSTENNL